MKKYIIKLNNKVYEVEMEEVTEETAVSQTNKIAAGGNNTPSNSTSQNNSAISAKGEVIEAPMPGTILNVAVNPGQAVKKGDLLVILEAMKMENEIVSPVDGTITNVNVTKGQTVNPGDTLVVIA
ncbi:Biotin-requiring enzyme [Clostridium amylolyticum]|uniref:Biotin-requiring enzyme n=1 Tax=Clostridium amylolyticum TaxID=1121298 RepID=A0A1M6LXV0_9CLOT|nr:acetyl-CoA carboxylase biotin carboxyl carrier protein subunit [Clostridium amylolyticum]SHJ76028.1 Biotin-requiring enzyme [Clostridium amylolyticum]